MLPTIVLLACVAIFANVVPASLSLSASELISIVESSTSTVNVTAPLEPPPDKPSPAVTPVISPATPTN